MNKDLLKGYIALNIGYEIISQFCGVDYQEEYYNIDEILDQIEGEMIENGRNKDNN